MPYPLSSGMGGSQTCLVPDSLVTKHLQSCLYIRKSDKIKLYWIVSSITWHQWVNYWTRKEK